MCDDQLKMYIECGGGDDSVALCDVSLDFWILRSQVRMTWLSRLIDKAVFVDLNVPTSVETAMSKNDGIPIVFDEDDF